MTVDHWQRAKELFADAVELAAAERPAFLDGACSGDDKLREEVEQLLAGDRRKAASMLEAGAPVHLLTDIFGTEPGSA
ncbi:MAG: hypothetical protein ACYST0_04005 [Planctomycetota bacterium]|jgi:hypothetical protein